ncbi:MAG: type II toxin-antitoxin system VapC family toxin [Chloroflexota bacterium]
MIFIDTSALAKRYVREEGSADVLRAMDRDPIWSVSALALTEASIMLCRTAAESATRSRALRQLQLDWDRFLVVPVDSDCLSAATQIGCEHRIRTLDAIHVAAARRLPPPVTFVSFDRRQMDTARILGLDVLDT